MDGYGYEGLCWLVHPLIPVSGTGTGLSPLPSRERGIWLVDVVLLSAQPFTSGLRIKSAMT